MWKTGIIIPVECKETVSELIKVLAYPKFNLKKEDIDVLLSEFLPYAEIAVLKPSTKAVEGLGNPDDAVFIHLAREAKTDFQVSGNRHILALKGSYSYLSIISPADLIKQFQK